MSSIPLNDDECKFVEFIKSFSSYYKPAYVISKNDKGEPLLNNKKGKNQFPMYDLDKICASCSLFRKGNVVFTPKTTDALWYKKHENGDFYIFLIEFKGHNLSNKSNKCDLVEYLDILKQRKKDNPNDPYAGMDASIIKKIIQKYSDKLLNGLALKPLETITIALPLIYQEYCSKHEDIETIDIVSFLRKSKIVYRVVCALEDQNDSSPGNSFRERADAQRMGNQNPDVCREQGLIEDDYELLESLESNLATYYKRYAEANIILDTDNFMDKRQFNNFINNHLK